MRRRIREPISERPTLPDSDEREQLRYYEYWNDEELQIALAENGYRREFRDLVMADARFGVGRRKRSMECAFCEGELSFLHGMWWHIQEFGYRRDCPRAFKGL